MSQHEREREPPAISQSELWLGLELELWLGLELEL